MPRRSATGGRKKARENWRWTVQRILMYGGVGQMRRRIRAEEPAGAEPDGSGGDDIAGAGGYSKREMAALLKFCHRNSLLSQLPTSDQIMLANTFELKVVEAGEALFYQGAPTAGGMFYICLSGRCAVYANDVYDIQRNEGEALDQWWTHHHGSLDSCDFGTRVAVLGRDATFGENMKRSKQRSASVVAVDKSVLVCAKLSRLYDAVDHNPDCVITSKAIQRILVAPPTSAKGRPMSDAIYLAAWIAQIRFFSQLPPYILIFVSRFITMETFARGAVIDQSGESPLLHVICNGLVNVHVGGGAPQAPQHRAHHAHTHHGHHHGHNHAHAHHRRRHHTHRRHHHSHLHTEAAHAKAHGHHDDDDDHSHEEDLSSESDTGSSSSGTSSSDSTGWESPSDTSSSSAGVSGSSSYSSEDDDANEHPAADANHAAAAATTTTADPTSPAVEQFGPALATFEVGDSFGQHTFADLGEGGKFGRAVAVAAGERSTRVLTVPHHLFQDAVESFGKALNYSMASAIKALKRTPMLRSEEECRLIGRYCESEPLSEFFSQLPGVIVTQIASVARYSILRKGHAL